MLLNDEDNSFWETEVAEANGFTRAYFHDRVEENWNLIDVKLEEAQSSGESTTGMRRQHAKTFWAGHERFLLALLDYWVQDERNRQAIDGFASNLRAMFKKTALYNGINPKDWA